MTRRTHYPSIYWAALIVFIIGCQQPVPVRQEQARAVVPATGRITRFEGSTLPPDMATRKMAAPKRLSAIFEASQRLPESIVPQAHMRTFTSDDGLPVDDIRCSFTDQHGVLWFGTNGGGVISWDGFRFSEYTVQNGLPDNVILSLAEDHQGRLWIGTSTGGPCMYDGHRFRTFPHFAGSPEDGVKRGITSIVCLEDGTVLMGTRGLGIISYRDDQFSSLVSEINAGANFIRDMAPDQLGGCWAATMYGLSYWKDGTRKQFISFPEFSPEGIRSVQYREGSLYVVTESAGLWCLTFTDKQELSAIRSVPVPKECTDTRVIRFDPDGKLWVLTQNNGAFELRGCSDPTTNPTAFQYTHKNGLAKGELLSVTFDANSNPWLTTRSSGITQFLGRAFTNYHFSEPLSITPLRNGGIIFSNGYEIIGIRDDETYLLTDYSPNLINTIYSLGEDTLGHLYHGWNAAEGQPQGVLYHGTSSSEVYVSLTHGINLEYFSTEKVNNGDIWAASRRGIEHFYEDDSGQLRVVNITTDQGLGNNNALCLLRHSDGSIWCGTDMGGISRIDQESCTTWDTSSGLPNSVVWSLAEDQSGVIWVATFDGLCRYDGTSFLTYRTSDGLPDHQIVNLLICKDGPLRSGQKSPFAGDLLVGTLSGICRLNGWRTPDGTLVEFEQLGHTSNEELKDWQPLFETYNSSTGFPIKDIQTAKGSIVEDADGVIWLSTASASTGLVRLDPFSLHHADQALDVAIHSLSVHDQPISWHALHPLYRSDSALLSQQEIRIFGRALAQTERDSLKQVYGSIQFDSITAFRAIPSGLTLPYKHNHLLIDFGTVETTRPQLVQYRYKLQGYDDRWSLPSSGTTATYGNIREGDYTFLVSAKNPSGSWGPPATYSFSVLPPWYRSWWAYLLYAFSFGAGLLILIKTRTSALQRQTLKLEQLVESRTTELMRQKQESDQLRSRAEDSEKAKQQFLANMSHEIRTPMNAIMGMTSILQRKEHPQEQDRYLNAIRQSSENLLVILNDILDMSKIEAGKIDFERVDFEPRKILSMIVDILHFKAEEKGLELRAEADPGVPAVLTGDPIRLNQVILNLAGNGIKFTEKGGVNIRMSASPVKDQNTILTIRVEDTGIGIAADRIDKIFEEFTQAYSDTTRKFGGTGLGLTISKRLVELQQGTIRVTSTPGIGSTFEVQIPYQVGDAASASGEDFSLETIHLHNLRILLAEDNEFNVMVATEELRDAIPGVVVDVAANGKRAVEMFGQATYDLVLMDVQMPEMNGYDATRAIRSGSERGRSVPIIALTANMMKAELDMCRDAGMNGIVPKPFTTRELIAELKKVIHK